MRFSDEGTPGCEPLASWLLLLQVVILATQCGVRSLGQVARVGVYGNRLGIRPAVHSETYCVLSRLQAGRTAPPSASLRFFLRGRRRSRRVTRVSWWRSHRAAPAEPTRRDNIQRDAVHPGRGGRWQSRLLPYRLHIDRLRIHRLNRSVARSTGANAARLLSISSNFIGSLVPTSASSKLIRPPADSAPAALREEVACRSCCR